MEKNTGAKTEFNRPPIVTVMGHVDHGKTSILDAIRKTNVQLKEYGGITQHIGAYQVQYKSQKITFIDTPGHAAFTQMRSRGGKAADIVILVVAADEGVKPQTKEAISHIKHANVPVIVAINKIDKEGSDINKVKQELASENILIEDWGGDVVCIEVSAKENKNLDKLLEAILAVSELLQLKANTQEELEALIIESRLDRKKGVVVSCIVKNGKLSVGDKVIAGKFEGKVRSIMNDKGEMLQEALPGDPVEVMGFGDVPNVGDLIVTYGSELSALTVDEDRIEIVGKDAKKTITLVLKADTQGTLEAVKESLSNLVSSSAGSSFALKFIHCGTGDISESDVMLATDTKGIVVGFNVKIPSSVYDFATENKVIAKSYQAIYELIDDVKKLLEGSATLEEEKIKGRAIVLKTFKLPSRDVIAGCKVLAGVLKENSRIRIYDKDPADVKDDYEALYVGSIKKIKEGKNEIKLAGKDKECGILLKPEFLDIRKDLFIEVI